MRDPRSRGDLHVHLEDGWTPTDLGDDRTLWTPREWHPEADENEHVVHVPPPKTP